MEKVRRRMRDKQMLAVCSDPGRAFRLDGPDHLNPLLQHGHESARPRVFDAAQLANQPVVSKDWNLFLALGREAPAGEPNKWIKNAWGGIAELPNPPGADPDSSFVVRHFSF